MDTILVFAGGDLPPPEVTQDLPIPDLVVAADCGYSTAVALGFRVDVLVGDLDSIGDVEIPDHVIVERHPEDKDQTDLDLALELAARESPQRLIVVGGTGGRHDHELATAPLLASDRWSGIDEIDWISGRSRSHVVRDHRSVHGDVGALVTLLAMGGVASGLTTRGLQWDLANATLVPGSTWGVSNVLRAPVAEVWVASGTVLAVLPVIGAQ